MSWDKNTINMSTIQSIIVILKQLNIKYKVTEIKKVSGMGNNDNPGDFYSLQKLEIKDMIYIDQMINTTDCDSDDTIITHKFSKKLGIPPNFKVQFTLDNS